MAKRPSRRHAKRHGRHQKHTPDFLKVYWPYMPLAMILIIGLFITMPWKMVRQSSHGVLAYATNTTVDGLLQATNSQRASNGKGALSVNGQLNSAAQAKAQDMVNRNYWSHNTPDGQTPWTFINATGYKYQKAGENLAYGFGTSTETVSGWMNSPSHRDNMLDSSFTNVGFGIANSPDYQSTGPETVVVAMYAEPVVLSASSLSPSPTPSTTTTVKKTTPTPTPNPTPTPVAQATPTADPEPAKVAETEAVNTQRQSVAEPSPQAISRVQALTLGKMPWIGYATGIFTGMGVALLFLKHGLVLKRMLVNGERFIYKHALFDITVIAFVALCVVSAHSVGVIR